MLPKVISHMMNSVDGRLFPATPAQIKEWTGR